MLPVGHPYRHSTIGSLADLDAASLPDVRKWFRDHYGPNNVVLALTGDIDAATARPIVEKWFGAIPRGPEIAPVQAPTVTLPAPAVRDIADQVPVVRITRSWTGPGINHPDAAALQVGLYVLGGLASSRLDNALVRGSELAVRVSASDQQHEELSFLQAEMDVKPGEDRAAAQARFDTVIADFIAQGPTQDELTRAATQVVSAQIGALERVGNFGRQGHDPGRRAGLFGRPGALQEGSGGDCGADSRAGPGRAPDLALAARAFNAGSGARHAYARRRHPGRLGGRGHRGSAQARCEEARRETRRKPRDCHPAHRRRRRAAVPPRSNAPRCRTASRSCWRGAPRSPRSVSTCDSTPVTRSMRGTGPGTHSLMIDALEEGTRTRDATRIAEDQERLGASINASSSLDSDDVTLTALTANLAPSLALMADIVKNPAFADKDVARVRDQRLADISQALANPSGIAARALLPLVYGDAHPYGTVGAAGTTAAIETVTPQALAIEHRRWLRPDTAAFTVVGDVNDGAAAAPARGCVRELALRPLGAADQGSVRRDPRAPKTRLVVIDRPNSPQSVIYAGRVLPVTGATKDLESLDLANEVLGDGFLSRLNMIIREDKGWSYGVRQPCVRSRRAATVHDRGARSGGSHGRFDRPDPLDHERFLGRQDRCRQDRAGPRDRRQYPRAAQSLRNQWPGAGRAARYAGARAARTITTPTLPRPIARSVASAIDASAKQYLGGSDLAVVVVGDRKVIDPQLARLGIPVEVMEAR